MTEEVDEHVRASLIKTHGNLYRGARLTRYPIPPFPLPPRDGRTLLDLGCNWGRWTIAAARAGYRPTGIDRGKKAIRTAQRVAEQLGIEAEYVLGDVRELPFPDRSFDAVVALDLLEHVPPADRPRALSELRRVTRRRLVVGCPTGEPALEADRRLAERLRRTPDWLVEHLENGFPAREELESELGPHGRLRLIPNEAVSSHIRLVRAELSIPGFLIGRLTAMPLARALRAEGRPRAFAGRVLRRVRGDDRPPAYRTIAVLDVS